MAEKPDKLKEKLLELLQISGKSGLDDVGKKLKVDKKLLLPVVEELAREGRIRVETRILKDPEIELIKTAAERKPDEIKVAKKVEGKVVESYDIVADDVKLPVKILEVGDYVRHYDVALPHIDLSTRAILDETKRMLVGDIQIETREAIDSETFQRLRERFVIHSKERLKDVLKERSEEDIGLLSRVLVNEMLGLGDLEYLLLDTNLEEVTVNNSREPVWVYHKKHGWLKTEMIIPTEDMIRNYSSRIAREVGREITHLEPLLDAHLLTGDRFNATLFPVSTQGNTITIRRFSRVPWTIVNLMSDELKTVNSSVAAFLWLAVEYELSMLVTGGTAAGKTTVLNAMMPFMPANQRIITMEDTRELNLPDYLQWISLVSRPPNPQGEGEVSMLDLAKNALRMRPDRVIIGEVRRREETEVLFEAMHTGHSVYGTFHADRAAEVVERITSPPMNIPGIVLGSLHLIVTTYRNRRTGTRRIFEIAELLRTETGKPNLNVLYIWDPKTDTTKPMYPSMRVKEEIETFTGMSEKEIKDNLDDKRMVLEVLLKQGIFDVNNVGRIISRYYMEPDKVIEAAKRGKSLKE